MVSAAISSGVSNGLESYFQQRNSDMKQLGKDLASGDTTDAEQEFQAMQTLGQSGPFASGDMFSNSTREADFNAIGTALQSGNLSAAQQAFEQLKQTFDTKKEQPTSPAIMTPAVPEAAAGATSSSGTSTGSGTEIVINLGSAASDGSGATSSTATSAGTSAASSTGPEIVLNLGAATAGEQITIDLNQTSGGNEQVTVGVSNQQNQNPEQVTLNLNQNSNEQIVLNLLNSAASTTATPASSVNLSA
jgi:hypothetical protein